MKTSYLSPRQKLLTLLIAGMLGVSGVKAQTTIADWGFNGSLTAAVTGHLTAASASLGSSIVSNSFNAGTEYYGQDGWPTGAVDPNAYLQFSVTANSGYLLSLNTVTLQIRRSNTGTPDGAGPNNFVLKSSVDGYSSTLYTSSQTDAYVTYTVNLPASFQTGSLGVTFRLYGYNTTINSGGSNRFVFGDISIQGSSYSGTLAALSIALSAKPLAGLVALQYTADGFESGTQFTVLRSVNGTDFQAIQQVADEATLTDAALPAGANELFYLVRAVQPDGSSYQSPIVAVSLDGVSGSNQIRGIVTQGATVKALLHIGQAGAYQLSIWSADGKPLLRQLVNGQNGDWQTDLVLGSRPHGVYVLSLSGNGHMLSRQFVF